MNPKTCAYCDPFQEDPRHIFDRIEKYIQPLEDTLLFFIFFLERFFPWYQRRVLLFFYAAFSFIHIIREKEIFDEKTLGSRANMVFQETHALGIVMKQIGIFGRKTNFFSLKKGTKKFIVEAGLPLVDACSYRYRLHRADDKYFLKKLLARYFLPYAEGRSFFSKEKAFYYGMKIGFPLVVKPRTGSLSIHVSCNILSQEEFREALDAAFFISAACVVERHISGDVYRMTIVRGKMVACCRREAPNVIGDGIHTVYKLIDEKNKDPRRGEMSDKNKTLHRLAVTPLTKILLKNEGMTLDSVLLAGKKIYLHSKVILAAGADIHDMTDEVHPEMKKICEKLAKLLNVPLLGFDVMCTNICHDPEDQPCAILEANTTPFIDMHHYPVTGTPRNVARILLEAQFE